MLASAVAFSACSKQTNEQQSTSAPQPTPTVVAEGAPCDTIVYNVQLVPRDEVDEDNLRRIDTQRLVNDLFTSVYMGKAKAFDYSKETEMSIDDVKEREVIDERFSRDKVAVLQFTEEWRYDADRVVFSKRVLTVHVAYAAYDGDGEFVGYRGGFILKMN